MQDHSTDTQSGINKGLVLWGVVLGLFTGLIGLAIALFGEKWKRRDRLIGIGAAWSVSIVLAIIVVAAGGGSDSKSSAKSAPPSTAKAAEQAAPTAQVAGATAAPSATPTPRYKFRITDFTCENSTVLGRTCKGTVTNISDKKITDTRPIIHWTGGVDSDLGVVSINPILPGQSATFTIYTLTANPALTAFTLGFKKIFGDEADFPVEPFTP